VQNKKKKIPSEDDLMREQDGAQHGGTTRASKEGEASQAGCP
jgi:hypothetical protein